MEGEECCWVGRGRVVPGFVLVLPRIGTAKSSSLDWSKGLDCLELGTIHLKGNPIGEKSESK